MQKFYVLFHKMFDKLILIFVEFCNLFLELNCDLRVIVTKIDVYFVNDLYIVTFTENGKLFEWNENVYTKLFESNNIQ